MNNFWSKWDEFVLEQEQEERRKFFEWVDAMPIPSGHREIVQDGKRILVLSSYKVAA